MSTLEVKEVSYVYGKGTPFEKKALDGVSVSFDAGKITGIIGHTGSGKSTLVNLLNGLLTPSEGQICFNGADISEKTATILKRELSKQKDAPSSQRKSKRELKREVERKKNSLRFRIGLVMQYPEYQLFADTVIEDIGYGPRNMGLDEQEILACSKEAAEMVGISEQMFERSPFDLSGGEKRRVAIAGILSMHPEILILDEPAAGLDPIGRKTVFEAIAKYNRETGATVILVSHSMEDLAAYCDKVLVMHNGKVHRHGTVNDVFSITSELPALGLDVPQVAHIAASLKEKGIELQGNLYTVDGLEKAILDYLKGGDAV